MDKFLKYSVLQYAPIARGRRSEKVALGVLFQEEASGHREFRFTEDLSRLEKFDDELDMKLIEKLLHGIKEEIESDQYKYYRTSDTFDIDDYTRFYINDYCFEDVQYVRCDDVDMEIDKITSRYLWC